MLSTTLGAGRLAWYLLPLLFIQLLLASPASWSGGLHHHEDEPQSHAHEESAQQEHNRVTIAPAIAAKSGIRTTAVSPGTIERHIKVYGRLVTPPAQMASARARFVGLITQVAVNIGDHVTRGDVLAYVESNQSLRDHAVLAPIDGVVQSRQANVGEIAEQQTLFTLVDNRRLWAEFKVFPSQRFEVRPGLAVHVVHSSHEHDSVIEHVVPGHQGQPYVIARVVLDNGQGEMAAGEMVTGQIDAEKISLPLVVEQQAVQTLRGDTVVFVQEEQHYVARNVRLGRGDGRYVEVLEGLSAGELYVVANSYLIKADFEKAAAEHQH